MNETDALNKLSARVEKLEKAVFGKKDKQKKTSQEGDFKGATGGIRLLISEGFFEKKRLFGEIKQALAEKSYHYSKQAVQTPLNALSKTGGPLVAFKESNKKVYAKRR